MSKYIILIVNLEIFLSTYEKRRYLAQHFELKQAGKRISLCLYAVDYYATKVGTVLFGGAAIRHSSSKHMQ